MLNHKLRIAFFLWNELYKGVKANSLSCGIGYLKEFLFFLLNTVGYYAELLLDLPNKVNCLFPSNGISLKHTIAMNPNGFRPFESKVTMSKTAGREGSLDYYLLN